MVNPMGTSTKVVGEIQFVLNGDNEKVIYDEMRTWCLFVIECIKHCVFTKLFFLKKIAKQVVLFKRYNIGHLLK